MSLTPEQREARKGRVGSTDIAAIVGYYRPELAHLSKKKNAADVWLRIVHDVEQPSRSVMTRGVVVEPILRDLYIETVGPVQTASLPTQHPALQWAAASLDAITPDAVVEFKSCSNWIRDRWGEVGTDKVPDDYNLQVQWLMECCDRQVAHVMVAWGNDEKDGTFTITETGAYVVRRDQQFADDLISLASRFMVEHVLPRVPPGVVPLHNKREFKRLTK